ncbi:MAG TPA: signal recognition particle protein [Planctomycetota bacterium]|nr:signal recognition particle protein [Planctomycetota bacterium]
MFEALTTPLRRILSGLSRPGTLTEANMEEGLGQIRGALLEADVHFRVATDLVDRVRAKALGTQVLKSVDAGQMIVKIFHDELVALLSAEGEAFTWAQGRPTVVLLAGLQGSGKTTTAAKLAVHLRDKWKRTPLLVAADLQRPAAVDQLRVLGAANDVPVFHATGLTPEEVARQALAEAKRTGRDTVLVDTAGRLHVDQELMDELVRVRAAVSPDTTFFVCDAMTGQDAVRSAQAFVERLPLDGVILTKLDGDTRGGAALSVRHVTGAPVRFVGMGEKVADLQPFHADRMAGRVLGMGDVVSLVEQAQGVIDEQAAQEQVERMLQDRFTLEDFLGQLQAVRKMGGMKKLVSHMPGLPEGFDADSLDEKKLDHTQAVVLSMTPQERRRPELLDMSRKRRIARGSGTSVPVVNELLKQFDGMRKMMNQVKQGGLLSRLAGKFMPGLGLGGGMPSAEDMADAQRALAGAGARAGARGPSKDDLRRQKKLERQRKKQARRRH